MGGAGPIRFGSMSGRKTSYDCWIKSVLVTPSSRLKNWPSSALKITEPLNLLEATFRFTARLLGRGP